MLTQSYFRYLFSDDHSIHKYYVERKKVSFKDIKRSLMLIERSNNVYIPDHYYRLGLEKSFEDIDNIGSIFRVGIVRLSDEYLEVRNGIVFVKAEKFNEWQLMLPYVPPMILVATRIWMEFSLPSDNYSKYITDNIVPNIKYTALPSPYIHQMEVLLEETEGLSDLHLHLNGALETDQTWQDFLKYPDKIGYEMKASSKEEKVKEQYLALSPYADEEKFPKLIRIASTLRYAIYEWMFCKKIGCLDNVSSKDKNFKLLLERIVDKSKDSQYNVHPMEQLLGKGFTDMQMECLLYIKVFDYIDENRNDETLINLFHYYMLILGLTNRMLVQQPQCFGFEEFQKYTMNGFRENSEKEYMRRFYQMAGNNLSHIGNLEGRFSPKEKPEDNEALLEKIVREWKKLNELQGELNKPESNLKLIAHFIKIKDRNRDEMIRHKLLRKSLKIRSEALVSFHNCGSKSSKLLVGVDAAASEFDAPPEVFSCAYRYLRKQGFKHFTYHAGEDFFHIMSGLRAMYEAVTFLDLSRGDRIGHGTACGVDPEVWKNNIGSTLLIRQGEYLDDLIFSFHIINEGEDEELKKLIPQLCERIENLSFDVYEELFPVVAHIKAWLMRGDDVEDVMKKEHYSKIDKLFLKYHHKSIDKNYNKIIEVDTYDIFDREKLIRMQQLILRSLHDKEIVIETLPTSNVVIGNHHDFGTYHLMNWLRWKKEGMPIPPIVTGSDDVGIFATNIYNEYCNIYCQLLYSKQWNSCDIVEIIKELNYNSKLYKF